MLRVFFIGQLLLANDTVALIICFIVNIILFGELCVL